MDFSYRQIPRIKHINLNFIIMFLSLIWLIGANYFDLFRWYLNLNRLNYFKYYWLFIHPPYIYFIPHCIITLLH